MDHLLDDEDIPRHERELTLSTGAILSIFVALVVLCGGFFGFGYNMGRKSAPTPLNLSASEVNPDAGLAAGAASAPGLKPAAGSPVEDNPVPAPAPKPARRAPVTPPVAAPALSADTVEAAPKPSPTARPAATGVPAAPIVRQPAPVSPAALSSTVPAATAAAGSFMVQVAAVSHKEDADLLLDALRSRGYAVSARSGAGDSFIHVQVGPFRDKKEADAMRQRLLTDGYNAIVKQ